LLGSEMTINFASTLWQRLGCRGAVSQEMYCWNCWKKEIIVAAIWLRSVGRNPIVERVNGSIQKQQKQLSEVDSFSCRQKIRYVSKLISTTNECQTVLLPSPELQASYQHDCMQQQHNVPAKDIF